MKKFLIILSVLAMILVFIPSAEAATLKPTIAGRSVIIHTPSNFVASKTYPIVISYHGWTSNASQQQMLTQMNPISDREGFIVVYPNGLSANWDSNPNSKDVQFTKDLISYMRANYSVGDIYVTGMSAGGAMANRIACDMADVVKAAAPVAAAVFNQTCNPVRPVPMMFFHGTKDYLVRVSVARTTVQNWVKINGTSTTAVNIFSSSDGTGVRYDGNTPVVYYEHRYGHIWPGSTVFFYGGARTIKASELMWAFFKAQ